MKNEIRKLNKTRRAKMQKEEVRAKSSASAGAFLLSNIYKEADCIMLYMPLGNEVETDEIIKDAYSRGKVVVFPVTDAESGKITPFQADVSQEFRKGAFSVPEPTSATKINPDLIDVVVVPGIAFDKSGTRIGFGKGCYDGFLKKTHAVKVGLCYDFQVYDELPCEEHDVKMDYLVTESGIIRLEKQNYDRL